MANPELLRIFLIAGLGGIFFVGFVALIGSGMASEFKNRNEWRELGKANCQRRRERGTWVHVSRDTCPGELQGADVLFVKEHTFLKGFVPPERGSTLRSSALRKRRAAGPK